MAATGDGRHWWSVMEDTASVAWPFRGNPAPARAVAAERAAIGRMPTRLHLPCISPYLPYTSPYLPCPGMMPTKARLPPAPGARAGYERGVWFWSDIVTGAARRGHNATSAAAGAAAAAAAAGAAAERAAAAAGVDVAASWVDRFSLGRAGSTSRGAHWASIRAAVPLAPRLSPGHG